MFEDHRTGYARTVLAIAAAVVVAAPALAQNTTAGIAGVVIGTDGKPMPGATVTIVHVDSGTSSTLTTDAQGRYTARGLRVGGPYTVTAGKAGATETREGIFLAVAENLNLDVRMVGAGSTVLVTGRGVSDKFNNTSMGSGTTLGSRDIAAYASISRSLQDYARLDPRLAQTDKERGEISAVGQNTRYNSITVDGVTTNDTFGLEANNLPTIKQPFSIDAIQSVQVNLSNYDVTQKGYTGANINAVTKSGTNDLKGSIYYVYRDDNLAGDRYNRTNDTYFAPPPFTEDTKGITLGGPIIKDRLFFFATYEEFKSSRSSPDFGPLGSVRTNVGISPGSVDSAISIAKNTWGIDVGSAEVPGGLEVSVKDTLLKLDWNINDFHRVNLRYTKTDQTEPNIAGFSGTGLSTSSWWWNQIKTVDSVVGQWFADWTPAISSELKISQRDYESRPFPVNGTRLPAIGLRFSGALPAGTPTSVNSNNRFLNMGTELSRHFNVLKTETLDVYAGATWNLGAHELKGGIDYSDNTIYNAFVQNSNGNYTFGCEPGTYSFGTFTNCTQMTAEQRELATLENFRAGKPSSFTLQTPLPGRTLGDAVADWSYANTGVFIQDNWRLNRQVNLMLGARVDRQSVPTRPLANTAASAPRGAADPVTGRATGGFGLDNTQTLDGNSLVQPRVGFNWDLGSEQRRMQLRGGFGLFQGAAASVWLSNPFTNTGVAVTTLTCTTYTACNNAGVLFKPDPDAQPRPTTTPPAANVDFLSPDLEQPSVWKANLAFDTELAPLPVVGRLTAGAEVLVTRTKSAIFYQHLNLGAPTGFGIDGRQLFHAPQAYQGSCWNADGSAISTGACATPSGRARTRYLNNPGFNNVYLAQKTDEGYGSAITLSLGQPAAQGFGWGVAYTKTTAKEVSPLTSSTSGSNWGNRNIFNPNEEVLQNSNYLVKDRVSANLTWGRAFVSNYRTSVGVFYEGRRGKPYSWTYLNDLNGDGQSGNDLMYIPSGPGSGEVVFRGGSAEEARFWEIVDANPALADARGSVVGRNNAHAPWVNNIDVRLSQELPGFAKGHKTTFVLDFLNFGNLLNKKWGRIDEIGFPSNRSFVNYNGVDANGRYIYSLGSVEDHVTRQASGESQWAIQATLRYEF